MSITFTLLNASGSLNPRGAYDAGVTYAANDLVTSGGSLYRSLVGSNTGHTPASSPTQWELEVSKGDAGATGATGATGPAGTIDPTVDAAFTHAQTITKTDGVGAGVVRTLTLAHDGGAGASGIGSGVAIEATTDAGTPGLTPVAAYDGIYTDPANATRIGAAILSAANHSGLFEGARVTADETSVASVELHGAAAGGPIVRPQGAATDIPLNLNAKGVSDVTLGSDIYAPGGFRHAIQFGKKDIGVGDSATYTSSTAVQIDWCGVGGITVGWVAERAGSVVGLSAALSAAAAGSDMRVSVFKNGVLLNAAAAIDFTAAGATTNSQTWAKDTYAFAAGDVLDVRVQTATTWSATTADLGVSLVVEN